MKYENYFKSIKYWYNIPYLRQQKNLNRNETRILTKNMTIGYDKSYS